MMTAQSEEGPTGRDSAELSRLRRQLARERAIRLEAERLLELKSLEIFERNRELQARIKQLEQENRALLAKLSALGPSA